MGRLHCSGCLYSAACSTCETCPTTSCSGSLHSASCSEAIELRIKGQSTAVLCDSDCPHRLQRSRGSTLYRGGPIAHSIHVCTPTDWAVRAACRCTVPRSLLYILYTARYCTVRSVQRTIYLVHTTHTSHDTGCTPSPRHNTYGHRSNQGQTAAITVSRPYRVSA